MYVLIRLISSEWLPQRFRLDVFEYNSNEFQHKINRDLSFTSNVHNDVRSVQNHSTVGPPYLILLVDIEKFVLVLYVLDQGGYKKDGEDS